MTSKSGKGKRKKQQTWEDVLRPFDEEYRKMLKAVDGKVKAMSPDELDRLSEALSKPSKPTAAGRYMRLCRTSKTR